ncbi:hypothetical protein ISM_01190 [Roseovarius nubinhibens ISM]|uniref:Uncharacterized protein n=1 Tax=Roseovarius nubinhibens (strain ATCC BAA-591 / DSM 15170 / ISM) TaxID=89187 RepID=A3SHN0_ROSNI|nr:hypothetical protein ISM_01190 [Roseovarius nubinhibens ISM]
MGLGAMCGNCCEISPGLAQPVLSQRGSPRWGERFCQINSLCQRGLILDPVDHRRKCGITRPMQPPLEHHLKRGIRPNKSRQPLRAAPARYQAKAHFGTDQPSLSGCHSAMGGQSQCHPGPAHEPVETRDGRNGESLQSSAERRQRLSRGVTLFCNGVKASAKLLPRPTQNKTRGFGFPALQTASQIIKRPQHIPAHLAGQIALRPRGQLQNGNAIRLSDQS